MTDACPYCDSADIYKHKTERGQIAADSRYVCYGCQRGFDQPIEREPQYEPPEPDALNGFSADTKAMIRELQDV